MKNNIFSSMALVTSFTLLLSDASQNNSKIIFEKFISSQHKYYEGQVLT